MFTKSTIQYFILSLVLLTAATSLTAYLWLDIEARGAELAANVQVIEDQDFLAKEEIRLSMLLEETVSEREQLEQFVLSDESAAVDFLSEIDRVASQLSLGVETSNLQVVETTRPNFDELAVNFIFSGSESSAMTMLSYLESLSYSSSLVSVQITRTNAGGTTLSTSLRLSIKEND